MDRAGRLEVTIVNKFYPPNKVIVAEAASDLAQYLIANGVHVKVVHTEGYYAGGGATGKAVGEIHKIKALYSGKRSLLRFVSEFIESYKLMRRAIKISKGRIIVMTAPGFLPFWASKLLKKRKNLSWIYWTMDLFPEAFVAGKLTSPNNPLYKYFLKTTYSYPPEILLALGEVQATYLKETFKKDLETVLLPCGVMLDSKGKEETADLPEWKQHPDKIYFGYVGNLGEAHSAKFIQWVIDAIDPEKHHLVLVVYGRKASIVKDYIAGGREGVTLLDFVPRVQLSHIDIHLTSLKKDFVNVCVPSKLVSAVYMGSVFLFFGVENCDSWQYLKKAGWLIKDNGSGQEQVAAFVQNVSKEKILNKQKIAEDMPELLLSNTAKAYNQLLELIKGNKTS